MPDLILPTVTILVILLWIPAAYVLGRRHERRAMLPAADAAARYNMACRDVMTWCCEDEFKAARNVAAHIMAHGEGEALNAGTPCGDEPCTINGLRQQLRRTAAA